MAYAELMCRSNFSFLRGGSHPEELVARAAELGHSALGLADLDGVYGLAKAFWRAKDHPGIKLVYGAELTLEGAAPLVLHAKDRAGWALLCRLITASHAGKPKGEAGLAWGDFAGMVAASPGRGGLLCLPRRRGPHEGEMKDLFGADLFFPLGRFHDGEDARRTREAAEFARLTGAGVLACNDVHYHVKERRRLQDALACVREGLGLDRAGTLLFSNSERHLKSEAEMRRLFEDWPSCVDLSAEAASRCAFSLDQLRYRYPSEWIPAGLGAQAYLEKLCWEGARSKFKEGMPEQWKHQMAAELKVIEAKGFADYFLTIQDIVGFARSRGILCQGRGSAANSVACYCLDITPVEPGLIGNLFERFISMERSEPPDIDVDFEHERREEVIQELYRKYGRDRAAMVATVIKYRSRSALADLSKALGRPERAGRTLRDLELSDYGPAVAALAEEARDFPRHLSIHSGGFVLSGEPLIDTVPIEPARMEGRSVIQWDKFDLDYVGMMKVDVLALGMLTALRRAMDFCGYAGLESLPLEDKATYAMIQKADTLGVFQIESRAQMNMLGRLRPEKFYDLVIEVAIVRPGPIVGKMVHPYLKRRQGIEKVEFEHEKLRPILEKTLGVPLFQEQVMRISMDLAGFSAGKADELRRAIGAWRSDGRLEKIGLELKRGLREKGLGEEFIGRLYEQIKGFADYGFPEAHAAAFSILVYASAYLKCHHPAEFTAALINSQPMGFYASHSLLDDAKRHGVKVEPIDPNLSGWHCQAKPGWIRLGWCVAEGLGKETAERLVEERLSAPFADLDDFAVRSRLKPSLLRRLALGDSFACFGLNQRDALWRVLLMEALAWSREKASQSPQLSLFSSLSPRALPQAGFEALAPAESVWSEYQAFGLSTRAHPMEVLRPYWPGLPPTRSFQAREARSGAWWSLAGLLIVRQRPGAGKVVFATLEDETGLLDLVLHLDVYEKFREEFLNHSFFHAEGILQRDQDSVSLLLKKLKPLSLEKSLKASSHDWH